MIEILGISGSPRVNGNTDILVKFALDGAEQEGASTEFVKLSRLRIEHCRGCWSCEDGRCVIDDDMQDLYARLKECDGLILGSPVYFENVSSWMKAFIDRCLPLYNTGELSGKMAACIAVGEDPGYSGYALHSMIRFLHLCEAEVVDAIIVYAGEAGEISKKELYLELAENLGRNLVSCIREARRREE